MACSKVVPRGKKRVIEGVLIVFEQLTSSFKRGTPRVTFVLLLTPELWNVSRTARPLAVTMLRVSATVKSYTCSWVEGQHSMRAMGSPRVRRFLFFDRSMQRPYSGSPSTIHTPCTVRVPDVANSSCRPSTRCFDREPTAHRWPAYVCTALSRPRTNVLGAAKAKLGTTLALPEPHRVSSTKTRAVLRVLLPASC